MPKRAKRETLPLVPDAEYVFHARAAFLEYLRQVGKTPTGWREGSPWADLRTNVWPKWQASRDNRVLARSWLRQQAKSPGGEEAEDLFRFFRPVRVPRDGIMPLAQWLKRWNLIGHASGEPRGEPRGLWVPTVMIGVLNRWLKNPVLAAHGAVVLATPAEWIPTITWERRFEWSPSTGTVEEAEAAIAALMRELAALRETIQQKALALEQAGWQPLAESRTVMTLERFVWYWCHRVPVEDRNAMAYWRNLLQLPEGRPHRKVRLKP